MDELEYHSIHQRSTENIVEIQVNALVNLIDLEKISLSNLSVSQIAKQLTKRRLPVPFILVWMGFGRIKDTKKMEKDVAINPATFDQASLTRQKFMPMNVKMPFSEYMPELIELKFPCAMNSAEIRQILYMSKKFM